MAMDFDKVKLGANPPKYKSDMLFLEDYMPDVSQLPPLQEEVDYHKKISKWTVLGNHDYGDCVAAAGCHQEQIMTANAANEVIVPDQTCIDIYLAINHGKDVGLYLVEWLDWWCKNGLPGVRADGKKVVTSPIAGYAALNPINPTIMRYGIEIFGAVFYAISLPLSAKDQIQAGKPWDVPAGGPVGRGAPNSWGGHGVTTGKYAKFGVNTVTWGTEQPTTNAFMGTYCPEMYVVFTVDWFDKAHKTPGLGLNWSQMMRDAKLVSH